MCEVFFRCQTAGICLAVLGAGGLVLLLAGNVGHTAAPFGIETIVNLIEKVAETVAHQRA